MPEQEIAIKVTGISKTFKPESSSRTVKDAFINMGRRVLGKHKPAHVRGEYTALKDINFEINKGDFFGIVGRNGSGKSTLLKILAGVYTPTEGHVQINGKLTPFIELGVGFNPELSGRDNVYLNGALLGFTRKQMEAMYDDIVDFAELHNFMETKLKNYSSGMQVRLAFSVAIRAESDILLIDEVLAVGDAAFQTKCEDYFMKLKNDKKTVVLVTHDMNAIKKYCDKAMLINNSNLVAFGNSKIIADKYEEINNEAFEQSSDRSHDDSDLLIDGAIIEKCSTLDSLYKSKKVFSFKDRIILRVVYKLEKDITNASIDIGITLGKNGLLLFYYDSGLNGKKYSGNKGQKIVIECSIENIYSEGTYYVLSSMYNYEDNTVYARNRTLTKIKINKLPTSGLVLPEHEVKITKE